MRTLDSIGRIKGQWTRGACLKWKKVISSLSFLAQKKEKEIPMSVSPEAVNH